MTRMTVLHIASPFAFSMPMPERNATQAAAPATGDAALVTTSADHAVTSADDATPEGESGRFDAWMRIVEVTIDGRGKMGSKVGASEEIRSGGVGVENLLME